MQGLSSKCPHCGTNGSFFRFCNEQRDFNEGMVWHIVAVCGVCKGAVLIQLRDASGSGISPMQWAKEKPVLDRFLLKGLLPEQPIERIPKGIPENVNLPLLEAERSFSAGHYSAAASCYRKATERSLKALIPDKKGTLNSRIRMLETDGLLPSSLIDLLDQVRLFGNEAIHEDDIDPTKEDCATARDFVDLFLTYAFSLPQKVAEAQAKRTS